MINTEFCQDYLTPNNQSIQALRENSGWQWVLQRLERRLSERCRIFLFLDRAGLKEASKKLSERKPRSPRAWGIQGLFLWIGPKGRRLMGASCLTKERAELSQALPQCHRLRTQGNSVGPAKRAGLELNRKELAQENLLEKKVDASRGVTKVGN